MVCDNLSGGEGDPEVCEVGGGGLILPLGGDSEQEWDNGLRIALYLIGLLWCFMGVAIIADVFMGAIEKITSKKILIFDKKLNKKRTMTVWNPTVANLTLMALGSSAPEILLNVVGIFPEFKAGDLGPSTIVGSAAFNLLVISAVCVCAIPDGEVRKIKDMGVFACTCFFSIFAYVWLIIILALPPSKDVVTVYEGVLTFVFFWVLVLLAFLFDTGKIPGFAKEPQGHQVQRDSTHQELFEMEQEVRQKYGANVNLTPEQVAVLIDYEYYSPCSRAMLRVQATRGMSGGKKVGLESRYEKGAKMAKELLASIGVAQVQVEEGGKPQVSFRSLNYTVLESVGTVEIKVQLMGKLDEDVEVKYATRDGTATKGSDYVHKEGVLKFGPQQKEATIPIKIIDEQGTHESTEEFYVDIMEHNNEKGKYALGKVATATIVIIDEDLPGKLCFEKEQIEVPATNEDIEVHVRVLRKNGSTGAVKCRAYTEDGTAIKDADYEAFDSILEFDNGAVSADLTVKVLRKGRYEGEELFRIVLSDATGGATFDNTTDGGKDSAILSVIIKPDKDGQSKLDALHRLVGVNWDAVGIGNANYKDQFIAAIYCNGSAEDQQEAKAADWVMHIVSLPWKLLFALVPPTEYAGGWICFFVALAMIGVVTVIIGDMAELLGCTMGISAATTAVTLVALGTSLPDTFASKTAAQMDPFADNSIGNITGSNSVNVFLGLGLPWMIQAIFWEIQDCVPGDKWYVMYPDVAKDFPSGAFAVPAGSLTISVIAFCCCALVCVATLMLRRKVYGGELGGPKGTAYATALLFVLLWITYIVISIMSED
mmetsp:Transcript_1113/g.2447  ORF Transcript_1113/g.2447 Transcript_1113/m.2447 type:complete len:823 (+) Transcript_1113:286-2754(+)